MVPFFGSPLSFAGSERRSFMLFAFREHHIPELFQTIARCAPGYHASESTGAVSLVFSALSGFPELRMHASVHGVQHEPNGHPGKEANERRRRRGAHEDTRA